MARSASSFNRPTPRFKPQPTVLVICEDTESGKTYLEEAAKHFRVNVQVEIAHCGKTDPIGIVEEAIRRQSKFDKVFCAIDRDNHPSFDPALHLARGADKITVIASYPCFEFWLLLHFGYSRKPFTPVGKESAGARVVNELRTYPGMDRYDKGANGSVFLFLLDKLPIARKNSVNVLRDAIDCGEMNPSTRVHELLDTFEMLSKPQLK